MFFRGVLLSIIVFSNFIFHAYGNFYVGAGISFSSNSYSTTGEVTDTNNEIITSSYSILSNFDPPTLFIEMNNLVSTNNYTLGIFPTIDTTGPTPVFAEACVSSNGVFLQYYNSSGCTSNGGNWITPNEQQIVQSIGFAYLTTLIDNDLIIVNPTDITTLNEIALQVGTIITTASLGTSLPTAQQYVDGGGIFQPMQLIDSNATIYVAMPNNIPEDIYLEYLSTFSDINTQILTLLTVEEEITFPASLISDSAKKNAIELSLMAGYLARSGRIFYGAEGVIDISPIRIGSNANKEIELKYNFTLSLVGKLGISVVENSVNYLTAGVAGRQYKTNYFDITNSEFIPHAVIGTGMEVVLTDKVNIFVEFNYITTISKMKTNISDLKLKVHTEKLTVGVKYYFNHNPVGEKKQNKNSLQARQENTQVLQEAFTPPPTQEVVKEEPKKVIAESKASTKKIKKPKKPIEHDVRFIDSAKQLSEKEIIAQEVKVELKREMIKNKK